MSADAIYAWQHADATKSFHYCAATTLWVANSLSTTSIPAEQAAVVVSLLRHPDPLLLRYSSLTTWLMARHEPNRAVLGEVGAVELLCGWVALLVLLIKTEQSEQRRAARNAPALGRRRRSRASRASDSSAAGNSQPATIENRAVARLRDKIAAGRETSSQLLVRLRAAASPMAQLTWRCVLPQAHVLGALWLLVSCPDNARRMVAAGGVELVADLLRLRKPPYAEVLHIAIGTMFCMSGVRIAPWVRFPPGPHCCFCCVFV